MCLVNSTLNISFFFLFYWYHYAPVLVRFTLYHVTKDIKCDVDLS